MTADPYGSCRHTKYDGAPPCIHDAYEQGRRDGYAKGYADGITTTVHGHLIYGYSLTRSGYDPNAKENRP